VKPSETRQVRAHSAPANGDQGREPVAKKILPIHLEARDREIVRRLGERDNVSMAEAVRRLIRGKAHEVVDPKPGAAGPSPDNAH
jgi:nitrogen-specific signal transduction histidine kinase